jgi:hypothetical protein
MDDGVYGIVNTGRRRLYIGSTIQGFRRRFSQHRDLLNAGRHHSLGLQADWFRDGPAAFSFVPIVIPENVYFDPLHIEVWFYDALDYLGWCQHLYNEVKPRYLRRSQLGPMDRVYLEHWYVHRFLDRCDALFNGIPPTPEGWLITT